MAVPGLSQWKAGRALGITGPAVAQWEREGGTAPEAWRQPHIAALYNTTVEALFGEEASFGQLATQDAGEFALLAAYRRMAAEQKPFLLKMVLAAAPPPAEAAAA